MLFAVLCSSCFPPPQYRFFHPTRPSVLLQRELFQPHQDIFLFRRQFLALDFLLPPPAFLSDLMFQFMLGAGGTAVIVVLFFLEVVLRAVVVDDAYEGLELLALELFLG